MATKKKATTTRKGKTSPKASTGKTTTTRRRTRSKKATLDKKNVKTTVKQVVESQREIKYNYPSEVDNQLDRKAWRQKVRNKNRKFIAKIAKLKESGNPGLKKQEIAYRRFRKEFYLVP